MPCLPITSTNYVKLVLPLIEKAKNSIDICVFDWRWYPYDPASPAQRFNQGIVQALRRLVTVRALVNSDAVAFELRAAGADVRKQVSRHLMHLKMMIIDERTVVTGSHNFTQSAFSANQELSVILTGDEVHPAFQEFFNNLYK